MKTRLDGWPQNFKKRDLNMLLNDNNTNQTLYSNKVLDEAIKLIKDRFIYLEADHKKIIQILKNLKIKNIMTDRWKCDLVWYSASEGWKPKINDYVIGYYHFARSGCKFLITRFTDDGRWKDENGHVLGAPTDWAFLLPPEKYENSRTNIK